MKPVLNFFFLLAAALASCNEKEPPPAVHTLYDSIPAAVPLKPLLKEVSGMAVSKTAPQAFWVEEDSGNPPQIYLVGYDGAVKKKVYIKGATNRDWEELQRSGNELYLAETGDNNRVYSDYAFYKFKEPTPETDTVTSFEKFRFQYEDGAHNAEAFLIDDATNDIFIITKSDDPAAIYKIAAPYSATELNTAVKVGQLTYKTVVGAALSPDGKEILVKTYSTIYRYLRNGKSLEAALQTTPVVVPYVVEPQGEALMFAPDNSGYYTLSERGFASSVRLYFYKRK